MCNQGRHRDDSRFRAPQKAPLLEGKFSVVQMLTVEKARIVVLEDFRC